MLDKIQNDGQVDFAKFVRKNAAEALELLLQHFDGDRPAPFDKVINNLISIESAAINEIALRDVPFLYEQIASSAAQVSNKEQPAFALGKDSGR